MGFFDRKPKLDTCIVCSELIPDERMAKTEHYAQHVFAVTDENGARAYSFKCPRCGTFPRAFGAGKADHIAREDAASMLVGHIEMGHDRLGVQWLP